jgi:hypothetical protein
MAFEVTVPEVQLMFNALYPPTTSSNILNGKIKRPPTSPALFISRYAALHPGSGRNKFLEAVILWSSMTDDEKQPWKELADRIRELYMATFSLQLRAAKRKATDGPSLRGHEVCLHGKRDLLPTEHFINQTGHSCNMTMVRPIGISMDPVLQHPAPLAIDNAPSTYSILDANASLSPIVGIAHPTDAPQWPFRTPIRNVLDQPASPLLSNLPISSTDSPNVSTTCSWPKGYGSLM